MSELINKRLNQSIQTFQQLLSPEYIRLIEKMANTIIEVLARKNRIFVAGNGGSAADAQHFVAELSGKFEIELKGLPAISLTTNTSSLTAIANDYGYQYVFSRQLYALSRAGDIFLGISTSGNSANIIEAMKVAKFKNLTILGLLGKDGGQTLELCDHALTVPSNNTYQIQEAHIIILHLICALIDQSFGSINNNFNDSRKKI